MKRNILICLSLILGAAGIVNCSSDSTATTPISSDFLTAETALINSTPKYNTVGSSSLEDKTAFSTYWDGLNNAFPSPGGDWSTTYTIKESLGQALKETNPSGIFGRLRTPFMIACILNELAAKDSDGSFTVGAGQTINISITNAVVNACFKGDTDSINTVNGKTITYDVVATSDTTSFDRHITMSYANNNFFGSNQEMWVRNNSTTLNFLHTEYRIEGGQFDKHLGYSHLAYNKSTGAIQFEYVSDDFIGSNDQFELYRIFVDPAAEQGRVIAFYGDSNPSATDHVSFALTANEIEPTLIGASVEWDVTSQGGSALNGVQNTGTDYEACVSVTDGSLTADNDITAGTCGVAGLSVSTVSIFGTVRAYTTLSNYTTLGESKAMTFDFTTIGTAGL